MPLMYMIFSVVTAYVIPKWIEIRVTLILGTVIMGISVLLVGPVFSQLNLTVMVIGLFMTGALLGPTLIPNMPEMMISAKLRYPHYDLEHANSLISGIYNSCLGVGQAIGPLLGAGLYQGLGFRAMCNITATACFVAAIAYFLCCQGWEAISTSCSNKKA